jgi:putative flippase GtrA
MPRERVVLTREPEGRPEPTPEQQAEYNRVYRRGFVYVGVGTLFDVAAAIFVVLGQWPAAIAAGVVGILIALLAAREFTRAGRAVQARRERGY